MNKTILLVQNGTMNSNVTKWVLTIIGLLYSIIGIRNIIDIPTSSWGWSSLIIGLLQATYAFILYDQKSFFAPKVIIGEDKISIREDVFRRTKFMNWNEIRRIEFKSYSLDFQFNDNTTQLINLRTNAETSIEIKKSLREIAEKKLINVQGG